MLASPNLDHTHTALLLALLDNPEGLPGWPHRRIRRTIEALGDIDALIRETPTGFEPIPRADLDALRAALTTDHIGAVRSRLQALHDRGIDVVTVLDDHYPRVLRQSHTHPAYLFVRGSLTPLQADSTPQPCIAIVGTRLPSIRGRHVAYEISASLSARGMSIVSGLAAGIDAIVHAAALDTYGHTVGVLGHGIDTDVFPSSNSRLATEIVTARGAVISQFRPEARPTRASFPLRNDTVSGLAWATVVIEASATSGARQAARRAAEFGRQVFVVRDLAGREPWALDAINRGRAIPVDNADDIDQMIRPPVLPQGMPYAFV